MTGMPSTNNAPCVSVVDDDPAILRALSSLFDTVRQPYRVFKSAEEFLATHREGSPGCVLLDIRKPEMDGMQLLQRLTESHSCLPVIVVTGHPDVALAVRAIKLGAFDLLEKPFNNQTILERVQQAFHRSASCLEARRARERARARVAKLTHREREVFELLALGKTTKEIISALGISHQTLSIHRSRVHEKLEAQSLVYLVQVHRLLGQEPPEEASAPAPLGVSGGG